jgi:hypothetical protein
MNNCVICLKTIVIPAKINFKDQKEVCSHVFCMRCIYTYWKSKNLGKCPLCKKEIAYVYPVEACDPYYYQQLIKDVFVSNCPFEPSLPSCVGNCKPEQLENKEKKEKEKEKEEENKKEKKEKEKEEEDKKEIVSLA